MTTTDQTALHDATYFTNAFTSPDFVNSTETQFKICIDEKLKKIDQFIYVEARAQVIAGDDAGYVVVELREMFPFISNKEYDHIRTVLAEKFFCVDTRVYWDLVKAEVEKKKREEDAALYAEWKKTNATFVELYREWNKLNSFKKCITPEPRLDTSAGKVSFFTPWPCKLLNFFRKSLTN